MGYYIDTIEAVNLVIKADDFDAAYRALCDLNNRNDLKKGGVWPQEEAEGPNPNVWFSWMQWNYPEVCETLRDILTHIGYETSMEDGNLRIDSYHDKHGCEDVFLCALTPWLPRGSSILFQGEDNHQWMYVFNVDHYTEDHGEPAVTWDGPSCIAAGTFPWGMS